MATTKRDYYDILGVKRSADENELRRAFRRLARDYHPDVSKSPDAEERFKEVNEAYEVLSDPEKRRVYDQYGHAGVHGQFGPGADGYTNFGNFSDIFEQFGSFFGGAATGTRRGPQRGADLRYDLEITFEEAAFGCEKALEIPRWETCTACAGSGAEPNTETVRCPQCNGSGEIRRVQQSVFGQFVNVTACGKCHGEGKIVSTPCRSCRGEGRLRTLKQLKVKVPAGVDNGQQIRLSGEGESGPKGGPPGNLYVVLDVKAHRYFKRDGSDVYYELPLTFPQAALGDTLEVPTLEGTEKVQIPPGTQGGKQIRLREKGIPHLRGMGRGDQYVVVKLKTPSDLSARERELYEELARIGQKNGGGGGDDRGFFDRVKDTLGI
ncbi:MAG: molecular chaperone DnaJ [Chloroflexota bacterium]